MEPTSRKDTRIRSRLPSLLYIMYDTNVRPGTLSSLRNSTACPVQAARVPGILHRRASNMLKPYRTLFVHDKARRSLFVSRDIWAWFGFNFPLTTIFAFSQAGRKCWRYGESLVYSMYGGFLCALSTFFSLPCCRNTIKGVLQPQTIHQQVCKI